MDVHMAGGVNGGSVTKMIIVNSLHKRDNVAYTKIELDVKT